MTVTRYTPLEERLWASGRIEVHPLGCWEWTGKVFVSGYGAIWRDGRETTTHRVAYELAHGTIPAELVIDHLCFNRRCVNPTHLRVVTRGENSARMSDDARERQRAAASRPHSHCHRGHPLTVGNVYLTNGTKRRCRRCALDGVERRKRSNA